MADKSNAINFWAYPISKWFISKRVSMCVSNCKIKVSFVRKWKQQPAGCPQRETTRTTFGGRQMLLCLFVCPLWFGRCLNQICKLYLLNKYIKRNYNCSVLLTQMIRILQSKRRSHPLPSPSLSNFTIFALAYTYKTRDKCTTQDERWKSVITMQYLLNEWRTNALYLSLCLCRCVSMSLCWLMYFPFVDVSATRFGKEKQSKSTNGFQSNRIWIRNSRAW